MESIIVNFLLATSKKNKINMQQINKPTMPQNAKKTNGEVGVAGSNLHCAQRTGTVKEMNVTPNMCMVSWLENNHPFRDQMNFLVSPVKRLAVDTETPNSQVETVMHATATANEQTYQVYCYTCCCNKCTKFVL